MSLPLILASQSPRRAAIMTMLGIRFEILAPRYDEPAATGLTPELHCTDSAIHKAQAVSDQHPGRIVVAADTLVAYDSQNMGKPSSLKEAQEFLEALSGKTHRVITGLALITPENGLSAVHEITSVRFRTLSSGEIQWYLTTGEWKDKAGAYGIQGYGGALVESISGCYFNVVGLPIARFIALLCDKTRGYWPPA